MITSIGNIIISFAIINNIISFILFFFIYKKSKNLFEKLFIISTQLNFLFLILGFGCLVLLYLLSDFTNINVYFNSHINKPLIYKITGVWGNHEGSLLLWILIMSCYNLFFSFEKNINQTTKYLTIFFQTVMIFGFLLFLKLTSNPFIYNPNNNTEGGLGLNPILQDPALAIHPPLLYFGYVGYSIVLSLAVAGMINSQIEKNWIKVARKYSLFCWFMLTLGIAAGSFWAYYELGWGGWWFWDPVENASLMPWLAGLALIHSLIIINDNHQIKIWVVFLSILCFSLSLLGTFLVRSGVLMSVHTFANDPSRGLFILLIFFIITGFSFLIFFIKAPSDNSKSSFFLLNKTGSIIINNIIMTISCFTVLLGTIYPIIVENITNDRVSVGAPYFNSTVLPILLPGILIMAVAPSLSFKEKRLNKISLQFSILLIILLISFIGLLFININPWGIIGLSLSSWIIIASFIEMIKRISLKKINLIRMLLNNIGIIAHLGIAILIIGITVSSVWKKESIKIIDTGDTIKIEGYSLKLLSLTELSSKNYVTLSGKFSLIRQGKNLEEVIAEKRFYPVSNTMTTEAGIIHNFWEDIYIVIGEKHKNGWVVKVYQNPLISFIWIGIIIIALASFISIRKT